MDRKNDAGFTLVELLVVIGIIALLVGILLPSLAKARESSNAIKCAANLRSIGQGLAIYVSENKQTFPAAYIYAGQQIENGSQTPDAAINGYVHWSSNIYVQGKTPKDAFLCPTLEKGGLPPTNTTLDNLDAGQQNDNGANVVDQQAPRCAFTVNEAICPRNKFVLGFQGARRIYQFVRAGNVKNSTNTILATEWHADWRIVSDSGRSNPNDTVCKSHRPVHGFVGLTGELNMELLPPDPFGGRPTYRRATLADLGPDPVAGSAFSTRLDWVGRNHDRKRLVGSGFDNRRTNFLYVDGHVETKNIRETLEPEFQWGERFYSLSPNGDMAN